MIDYLKCRILFFALLQILDSLIDYAAARNGSVDVAVLVRPGAPQIAGSLTTTSPVRLYSIRREVENFM